MEIKLCLFTGLLIFFATSFLIETNEAFSIRVSRSSDNQNETDNLNLDEETKNSERRLDPISLPNVTDIDLESTTIIDEAENKEILTGQNSTLIDQNKSSETIKNQNEDLIMPSTTTIESTTSSTTSSPINIKTSSIHSIPESNQFALHKLDNSHDTIKIHELSTGGSLEADIRNSVKEEISIETDFEATALEVLEDIPEPEVRKSLTEDLLDGLNKGDNDGDDVNYDNMAKHIYGNIEKILIPITETILTETTMISNVSDSNELDNSINDTGKQNVNEIISTTEIKMDTVTETITKEEMKNNSDEVVQQSSLKLLLDKDEITLTTTDMTTTELMKNDDDERGMKQDEIHETTTLFNDESMSDTDSRQSRNLQINALGSSEIKLAIPYEFPVATDSRFKIFTSPKNDLSSHAHKILDLEKDRSSRMLLNDEYLDDSENFIDSNSGTDDDKLSDVDIRRIDNIDINGQTTSTEEIPIMHSGAIELRTIFPIEIEDDEENLDRTENPSLNIHQELSTVENEPLYIDSIEPSGIEVKHQENETISDFALENSNKINEKKGHSQENDIIDSNLENENSNKIFEEKQETDSDSVIEKIKDSTTTIRIETESFLNEIYKNDELTKSLTLENIESLTTTENVLKLNNNKKLEIIKNLNEDFLDNENEATENTSAERFYLNKSDSESESNTQNSESVNLEFSTQSTKSSDSKSSTSEEESNETTTEKSVTSSSSSEESSEKESKKTRKENENNISIYEILSGSSKVKNKESKEDSHEYELSENKLSSDNRGQGRSLDLPPIIPILKTLENDEINKINSLVNRKDHLIIKKPGVENENVSTSFKVLLPSDETTNMPPLIFETTTILPLKTLNNSKDALLEGKRSIGSVIDALENDNITSALSETLMEAAELTTEINRHIASFRSSMETNPSIPNEINESFTISNNDIMAPANIGNALPNHGIKVDAATTNSFVLILICTTSIILIIGVIVLSFFRFRGKHGTLDIQLEEQRNGKNNNNSRTDDSDTMSMNDEDDEDNESNSVTQSLRSHEPEDESILQSNEVSLLSKSHDDNESKSN